MRIKRAHIALKKTLRYIIDARFARVINPNNYLLLIMFTQITRVICAPTDNKMG